MPRDRIDVREFGAVGDGVTDDTASVRAAIAALPDGGILFLPPGGRYLIRGNNILNVDARDVTVIGYGAELWSENSEDPETAGPAFFPQLKFRRNARLYGLSWRGGIFTIATRRFRAFGGRSYHLHNAAFFVDKDAGVEYLKIADWEFDTSLDTSAGNYTAIQCGAQPTDPANDLAVIEDCTFRGTAGGVNLHNFDTVRIVRMKAQGIAVNHVKTAAGARRIEISGDFDGAPVAPGSSNRHLSSPSSYMAFLSSNELREVTLDVELRNFQGANGVYYVNTTSPIVTRGRLVARDCSVGVFNNCPGYLKLDVDLADCAGSAISLASPLGVWALRQEVTGRLFNSKMTIGNSSSNRLSHKRIEVRVVAEYDGTDGAIEAVDLSPTAGWDIDEVLVHDSHFKVTGGTAIVGEAGSFAFTIGRDNTYEGAAVNFTGDPEGGYRTGFGGGTIPLVQRGELNLRNTLATAVNYFFDNGKSSVGDRVRIINDGGSGVHLHLLTLDGYSNANILAPRATIEIVKIADESNAWRTVASYGDITQR